GTFGLAAAAPRTVLALEAGARAPRRAAVSRAACRSPLEKPGRFLTPSRVGSVVTLSCPLAARVTAGGPAASAGAVAVAAITHTATNIPFAFIFASPDVRVPERASPRYTRGDPAGEGREWMVSQVT